MSKKKKKWIKPRHAVIRNLAYGVIKPYSRWKYGVEIVPFREEQKRQYLILCNHQTVFDQFFIGISVRGPIYYLATEDIFSNGWISSLIRWLVAPIPIKKQTSDVSAVMNCMRVAKEGGTIALAPEGNRTYSGKTEYMNPAIAPLAKKLKLPILLYRIEGGYGVQPRWSDCIRKGKMKAYVSRVIEPEEYANLTNEELFALIEEGLAVNEGCLGGSFHHPKAAEYLERAVYVCPFCGLSTFESHGDTLECKKCGRKVQYLPTKELKGVGYDHPFRFMTEWYDYQEDFVNAMDTREYLQKPLYEDHANLSQVIVYKKKVPLMKNAALALYGDRITVNGEDRFPFEEISAVTVLGRNKLNIYHQGNIYQFKGDQRFNALKYVHLYYRSKNISKGEDHVKFLGL